MPQADTASEIGVTCRCAQTIVEKLSRVRLRPNRGEAIERLAAEKGSVDHEEDINDRSIQVIHLLWLPSCNYSQKYKSASY